MTFAEDAAGYDRKYFLDQCKIQKFLCSAFDRGVLDQQRAAADDLGLMVVSDDSGTFIVPVGYVALTTGVPDWHPSRRYGLMGDIRFPHQGGVTCPRATVIR